MATKIMAIDKVIFHFVENVLPRSSRIAIVGEKEIKLLRLRYGYGKTRSLLTLWISNMLATDS